jgi:plastocyanin
MIERWPRWPRALLMLVLALSLAPSAMLLARAPVAAQSAVGADVRLVNFTFDPGTLTVPAGTTVAWTNDDSAVHTVTADDGSFDSGRLDPGETFSVTFDTPGEFAYHCGFHPRMQGTIVVTEATEPAGDSGIEVATPMPEGHVMAEATPPAQTTATTATEPSTAGPSHQMATAEPSRLAHIHAGTCDELGIVVYSLPDIQTFRLDEGKSSGVGAFELITGTATVPLSGLFGEPFSIHVHESVQNKQVYIACADIGGAPPAPWTPEQGLVLEAHEQNDSGYSGFVALKPSASGGTNVTIALAASPEGVAAAAAHEAPPPPTTYTSPTFGYTIGYGPAWQESENSSTNGADRFVLFNGTSYITFTGERAFAGDPQACVDAFVMQLTADPNVSNLRLAVDDKGNPAEGGTAATGAFAIYDHDYAFPGRVEPYTLYVACVPLIPNEAVLAIVQNVPTADYNDQVQLREALLRGLTLAQ